jgi:arginase
MKKKVKIFGVPLDLGSRKLGVDMGPNALRHAGLHDALFFNGIEFNDFGDIHIPANFQKDSRHIIGKISEQLAELVYEALSGNYIPIILGGDHSVSVGSIAGAAKYKRNLGVIWFDCHPDANTPESSPSGNIHGMPVAISLGHGYSELVSCAKFSPKILPANLCIIGAKDIDKAERVFLDDLGVTMYTLFDINRIGIHKVMENVIKQLQGCDAVHLSFDIDVLDPLIAPGTGILSRGGLSYRESSFAMEYLAGLNIITSVDLIEVNPLMDIKNTTAELAIELLISVLGEKYGDYERKYILEQSNPCNSIKNYDGKQRNI